MNICISTCQVNSSFGILSLFETLDVDGDSVQIVSSNGFVDEPAMNDMTYDFLDITSV